MRRHGAFQRLLAYWERPKRADEWEAEVEAERGASNVSFTMSNTGGEWPELNGFVRIQDGEFGVVSIRVRGNFGDDGWGAWSPAYGVVLQPARGPVIARGLPRERATPHQRKEEP